MRIGIDVTPLLLRSAGVKTWTWHFFKNLVSNAEHDQIVPLPEISSLAPLVHDRSILGTLETWRRLASLYAINAPLSPVIGYVTRKVDVFHVSNQIRRMPERALVTATLHDMTCWIMPEFHTPANIRADRQFSSLLLKKAARMIAVSQNTKADAVRLLNVNPGRIEVIYPGVADHFFNAKPTQRSKPYVLYLGTLEPRKNVMTLLDAWHGVRDSIKGEFDLLIAGDAGWNCDDVVARLAQGLAGVHYLGYRPQHQLPGLLAGATVFVYPSLYEGFGFPVVEAMACGVPVITSNCSSLAEVAGTAAALIDPLSLDEIRNSLERLLTSPGLRESYRQQGLARAKDFTWAESARQALKFFHHAG
jgi:glycosyltransferase involved in cell wall biosynthesis